MEVPLIWAFVLCKNKRFSHEIVNVIVKTNKYMSLVLRKPAFCICEKKTQISFPVTAKLISAFVFATQIVQSLYFLNPKFQASSHLLWLHSPVCIEPGRKPRRPVFSERGSYQTRISQSLKPQKTNMECKIYQKGSILPLQSHYE